MGYIPGNDDYDGYFNWYKWSAPFFARPEEVHFHLESLDLCGKTLREVRVIGGAFDIGNVNGNILYHRVLQAGMEPADDFPASYPNLEKILVPQQVWLCEPIQSVFTDATTLEIQPIENGGARIGVNTIPLSITDGLNRSNLDAKIFFSEVCSEQLESFEVVVEEARTKYVRHYAGRSHTESCVKYLVSFRFSNGNEIMLTSDWTSWYHVELNRYGQECLIPYARVLEAKRGGEQITIINGRDGGGMFWIFPISLDDETVEEREPLADNYGISIDETDIHEFLSFFLVQQFDPAIQERDEWEENCFDSYGHNYYTFETMRRMLKEIRSVSRLLQEEYDHPMLDDLKSRFTWYLYTPKNWKEVTETEKNELRRNRVPLAADFYERFCVRMEEMMTLPGRNAISFAGP